MLNRSGGFEPLPNESIQHKTKGRVALEISAPSPGPGIPPLSLRCDRGVAFITNQRLLYLASAPTPDLQSYGTKILNVENSHTGSTWIGFGASFWEAEFRPVAGGNISAEYTRANMKLIFYDGGHSDWALKYENMRERVQHAAQMARETGQTNILNMVHGEDLPEYSPRAATFGPTEPPASQAQVEQRADEAARQQQAAQSPPDEPPPDYDAAQMQAVEMQFDERTRQDAERR